MRTEDRGLPKPTRTNRSTMGGPIGAPSPQQVKVHQIKARVAPLIDSGQYAIAIELLEEVLPLDRDDGMLHKMLGAGYAGMQNAQKATLHLRRAAELGFRDTDTLLSLASIYKENGNTHGSLQVVEKLLAELPADGRANRFKAFLLRSMGDPDKALAWIDTIHERVGPHPDTVILRAELLTRFKRFDEAQADLRGLLDEPKTTETHRRDAFFSLGKLLDLTERYDEAFDAISRANRMLPADEVVTPELFRERWSPEAIGAIPQLESPKNGDRPVFIIGMPRSGTTLTEQILAAHPSVATLGESPALNTLSRDQLPARFDTERLATIASAYLTETAPPPLRGKKRSANKVLRVVDKMPENYYYVPVIDRCLPASRVVHCTRDPRDIALSCFFQNFGTRLGWTRRLETIGNQHRLYRSVMNLWSETLDIEIFESNYETLTSDPRPSVETMLAHVGLPFDESCLAHHKNKSTVNTASVDQVRNPIYTTSQKKWERYEKHLGPLIEMLESE